MPFTLYIKRISTDISSQMIRDALGRNLQPNSIEIMMDGTAIIQFTDVSLFNQITSTFPTLVVRIGSYDCKLELPKNYQATIVLNRVPIFISQELLQVEVNRYLRKRNLKPCIANIFYRKIKSQSANLVFLGSHDAQAAMKVLIGTEFTREITNNCGMGHLTVIETEVADQRNGRSNEGEVFYIVARCYDQNVVYQKAEYNEIEIKKQYDTLTSQLKINQMNPLGQYIQSNAFPVVQQPLIQTMAMSPMQPYVYSQQMPPYYAQYAQQMPQYPQQFQQYPQQAPQMLSYTAQQQPIPLCMLLQSNQNASKTLPPQQMPSVTYAQPQNKPSSNSIYVANVPADASENTVKEQFEPYGPVLTSYKIYNGKTPFACYIIQFKDTVSVPNILQKRPTVLVDGQVVQIKPHITKAKH